MKLIEWLLRRTPTTTSPAPMILRTGANRDPIEIQVVFDIAELHRIDDDAEDADLSDDVRDDLSDRPAPVVVPIEDIYCMIEYRDANQNFSRRRVTLKTIRQGRSGPLIGAICHERRAFRTFRLDRIGVVIDADGEVHKPLEWITEYAGITSEFLVSPPGAEVAQRARELRLALQPELVILMTAARSDRNLHVSEIDAIEQFVEREVGHLQRANLIGEVSIETLDQMRSVISAMRPNPDTLFTAVRALANRPTDRADRLARALNDVINADSMVHPAEMDMLEQFEAHRTQSVHVGPVDSLRGQIVVFTGQLEAMTRKEASAAVHALGGTTLGHINSRVTLVVVGKDVGQKLVQARSLSIPVASESEFRRLAGLHSER